MLDGWGGSTEPWDDVESDCGDYGWCKNQSEYESEEKKYERYHEETYKNRNDKKYYMPDFPSF